MIGESNTPGIIFNATALLDCFLSTNYIEKSETQLYVAAALLIASKFADEEEYFSPYDLLDSCSRKYTLEDLFIAERRLFFDSMGALQMTTAIDILMSNSPVADLEYILQCAQAVLLSEPAGTEELVEKTTEFMSFLRQKKGENRDIVNINRCWKHLHQTIKTIDVSQVILAKLK
jgi:hypothetical protein